MKLKLVIIVGVMLFIAPIIVAKLLEINFFSFAKGEVDTWIMFWGSYLGAIVGAGVVYFVAQLQMKKQKELQIEAIKIENVNSTRREMHKFNLTNQLEKIEEMHELFNKLLLLSLNLNNDLLLFAISMESIEKDIKSTRESFDPKEKIYQLRGELKEYHLEMSYIFMRLTVLSEYINHEMKNEVLQLQEDFIEIYDEVRECYYSTELYKKYLKGSGDEPFILDNVKTFTSRVSLVSFGDLQRELRYTLQEIKIFIK